MNREKFEQLFTNVITMTNIKRRSLKELKNSENNIGFFICNNNADFEELVWIITSLNVKFQRVYTYIASSVNRTSNVVHDNVLNLFSDILVPIYFDENQLNADKFEKVKQHINDNIYFLSNNANYYTLDVADKEVVGLTYSPNMVKKIYNNSAFGTKHGMVSNKVILEIEDNGLDNCLPNDFYIKARTLSNLPDTLPDYMTCEAYIDMYVRLMWKHVSYVMSNVKEEWYDINAHDGQINKYLIEHPGLLVKWKEHYPEYNPECNNTDFFVKKSEFVLINHTTQQVTIENINTISKVISNFGGLLTVFDNIDQFKYPENNIYASKDRIINPTMIDIKFNNNDQIFTRKPLFNLNRRYGAERYEQTLAYLIEHSKSDFLICIGDKVIITKDIIGNPNMVWQGTLIDDEPAGYVDIFNIELMRKNEIKFNNFSEFIKTLDAKKLNYSYLKPDDFGMNLPVDFEKYNSTLFRVAHTKEQILFNHMADNYNYYFLTYENNNRYNQF